MLKDIFEEEKIFCLGSLKPELNKFQIEKKIQLNLRAQKKLLLYSVVLMITDHSLKF